MSKWISKKLPIDYKLPFQKLLFKTILSKSKHGYR